MFPWISLKAFQGFQVKDWKTLAQKIELTFVLYIMKMLLKTGLHLAIILIVVNLKHILVFTVIRSYPSFYAF